MKKDLLKKILPTMLVTLVVFCGLNVTLVHAQTPVSQPPYTVLVPLPGTTTNCNGSDSGENNDCTTTFQTYLPAIFNLSIGIAATLAFVMISYGGFQLMTTDSINGKTEGRKKVQDAVWGLLLVIGAYAILYTINPQLLNFNLNIGTPSYGNLPSGMITVSTDTGGTMNIPVATPAFQGYNLGAYAPTNPKQAALAEYIYATDLKSVSANQTSVDDAYIQKNFPNAPVTGAMITSAATTYGVDPKLMMAVMQTESHFGLTGTGAVTTNPGNVGNTGTQTKTYSDWQSGVNAVASWLNSNRAK